MGRRPGFMRFDLPVSSMEIVIGKFWGVEKSKICLLTVVRNVCGGLRKAKSVSCYPECLLGVRKVKSDCVRQNFGHLTYVSVKIRSKSGRHRRQYVCLPEIYRTG